MSIRSENNKIMLKIESMASRNERLVNISRKCNSFSIWNREILLPRKKKRRWNPHVSILSSENGEKIARSPGFVCLSNCKYANGNRNRIERRRKTTTEENKCVFCARLQFTKIERMNKKHILFFFYIKHFRCTRESNY